MTTIAAKPTEFRGITYRSRTEARWAVHFENTWRKFGTWLYEPYGPNEYRPDFVFCSPQRDHLEIWEIKPAMPSNQYMQWMTPLMRQLPKHWFESVPGLMGCSMRLGVGNFYQGERPGVWTLGDTWTFLEYLPGDMSLPAEHRFDLRE